MYKVTYHEPVGSGPFKNHGGYFGSLQAAVTAVAEFARTFRGTVNVSIYVPTRTLVASGRIGEGRWLEFSADKNYA